MSCVVVATESSIFVLDGRFAGKETLFSKVSRRVARFEREEGGKDVLFFPFPYASVFCHSK